MGYGTHWNVAAFPKWNRSKRSFLCGLYILMWRILSALCSYNCGKQPLLCIPSILGLCERKWMDTHIEWTVHMYGLCLIFHTLRQFWCLNVNVNVISNFLTTKMTKSVARQTKQFIKDIYEKIVYLLSYSTPSSFLSSVIPLFMSSWTQFNFCHLINSLHTSSPFGRRVWGVY